MEPKMFNFSKPNEESDENQNPNNNQQNNQQGYFNQGYNQPPNNGYPPQFQNQPLQIFIFHNRPLQRSLSGVAVDALLS